jgi:hypothetical protein
MEIEDKPSSVRMSTVDKAIRNAAYIQDEIDKQWPAPFPLQLDGLATGTINVI